MSSEKEDSCQKSENSEDLEFLLNEALCGFENAEKPRDVKEGFAIKMKIECYVISL
jgi:hypothetical protein